MATGGKTDAAKGDAGKTPAKTDAKAGKTDAKTETKPDAKAAPAKKKWSFKINSSLYHYR